MEHRDSKGDHFEYMLGEIATAGRNGHGQSALCPLARL
jgi:hypothetical protein